MFARGTNIAGYTLVRRLGAGGMGEIWEAVRRDGDFELRAAVKVANPDVLAMPEGRALFTREASLAASLRHPNIASVLSADLDQGLIFYELVDGADLRQLLSEGSGQRLPMPVIVSLLYQICRGLGHAHRREVAGKLSPVIHRDMSPGNVVIDYDGNLKIVDFGIAKAIAGSERSESIKGKISYMAPEQATAGDVDSRTDQYAVGVMAYEAIAGVRPNDGTHEGETLHNILQGHHRPLQEVAPQVPAGLATLVERMLAVSPAQRFPDMDAVIDALEPFRPKFAVHRDIAALVQKARPRQTIIFRGGQFDSIPAAAARASAQGTPVDARPAAPAPQGSGASPFAPTVMATDKPAAPTKPQPALDTPAAAPQKPVTRQPAHAVPRTNAPPRATLLVSTGAIVAAGLVVIVLWAMRDEQPAANAELTSNTSAAAPKAPSSPVAAEPAVDDSPAPSTPAPTPTPKPEAAAALPTGIEPQPEAPAEAAPAPPVTPTPVPAAPAPAKAPKLPTSSDVDEPSSSAGKGHLQVGVFPPTNVWIDGKKRGRSPLSVELRAGKHMVGAGEREPVIRQQVTIHENQTEKILLELGNQPTAVPDNQTP